MQGWITTSEAAARLGVKRGTLYSYVSRGVLTSRRMPGQAESLFDRTQIDSLAVAKHDGRRAGERLLRFRAVATRVSAIRDDRLHLRGVDIAEVCRTMDFAAAARFVLGVPPVAGPGEGELGSGEPGAGEPAATRVRGPGVADGIEATGVAEVTGGAAVPMRRRIPWIVASLAARDTCPERTDAAEVVLDLLPVLARAVPEIDFTHPWVDLLATTLIDNGMAASTTAARVAASARAGVLDALLAGYAALSGPLHGGAPASAYDLIDAVLAGADPGEAIAAATPVDGVPPGFGHVVYGGPDPRAQIVFDRLRADVPGSRAVAAADAVVAAAGRPVNVDLASAVVAAELGLGPRAGEVLFQYARTVGMAAHIAEEYTEAPLRWRGSNTG